MRITARGKVAFIKLEDKVSGKISCYIRVTATAHLFPSLKKTQVSGMVDRVAFVAVICPPVLQGSCLRRHR